MVGDEGAPFINRSQTDGVIPSLAVFREPIEDLGAGISIPLVQVQRDIDGPIGAYWSSHEPLLQYSILYYLLERIVNGFYSDSTTN